MKHALRIGGGLLAALVILWLAGGAWVWSRNSVPAPPAPKRNMPDGNVYPQYVELVKTVKDQKLIQRLHLNPDSPRAEVRRALQANAPALASLRELAGKPCAVTELRPGVRFVGALAFPGVTRLAALSIRESVRNDPAAALRDLTAALDFGAGVMREGATLHVTTSFLSLVPVFMDAHRVVPALNASQCKAGAAGVRRILDAQTPITTVFENERTVRLEQLASTVRPGATSIFRFQLPMEDYQRTFLMKPKRPAYEALDRYMQAWIEESRKPIMSIRPPEAPRELEGILADESLEPKAMGTHIMRHAYITARLRVLYAALVAEGYRKSRGSYPAKLDGLASADQLADPFSTGRLIYRGGGSRYTLYSVGPNGSDDGGAPYTESNMRPGQTGDLPLRATF